MEEFHREVEKILESLLKTQVNLTAYWVPDSKEAALIRQYNEYAWILECDRRGQWPTPNTAINPMKIKPCIFPL
jgi:hypothetical protein